MFGKKRKIIEESPEQKLRNEISSFEASFKISGATTTLGGYDGITRFKKMLNGDDETVKKALNWIKINPSDENIQQAKKWLSTLEK